MARKPENTFISGVHKHLANKVYYMKNNNPYTSGIPDVWYSGKTDLWVEYKYLERIPVKALIVPNLSALQKEWLNKRYQEGRQVAVIVGSPEGGVMLSDLAWETPVKPDYFRSQLKTKPELAKALLGRLLE